MRLRERFAKRAVALRGSLGRDAATVGKMLLRFSREGEQSSNNTVGRRRSRGRKHQLSSTAIASTFWGDCCDKRRRRDGRRQVQQRWPAKMGSSCCCNKKGCDEGSEQRSGRGVNDGLERCCHLTAGKEKLIGMGVANGKCQWRNKRRRREWRWRRKRSRRVMVAIEGTTGSNCGSG
ncbi:hypothetical protein B296_00054521 [Ensete ventricosum]|uniref:Uncharacterized protein n=1 Tax=Ensete ventricosum TaxID=4639 RepID=A0A426XB04_ENSVE|nr:hypothetical protein B296_00054521 [Ensete ventricosum]